MLLQPFWVQMKPNFRHHQMRRLLGQSNTVRTSIFLWYNNSDIHSLVFCGTNATVRVHQVHRSFPPTTKNPVFCSVYTISFHAFPLARIFSSLFFPEDIEFQTLVHLVLEAQQSNNYREIISCSFYYSTSKT